MKKITVLFLGKKGAGPLYSLEMAKALQNRVKMQVIISKQCDNIEEWIKFCKNNKFIELCCVNTYTSKGGFLLSFFNIFRHLKIAYQIKRFSPDFVYSPMISLLTPIIYLFLKKSYVVSTLHDPIPHQGENSYFTRFIMWLYLIRSGKVIILSKFFLDYTMSHYGIKQENIVVIPHASVNVAKLPLYNESLFYKLLFFGRIEEYKGIDLLLDSFSILHQEIPRVCLTIAGRGDLSKYSNKLERVKDSLIIENRWIEDNEIVDLISAHDLLVLPYIDASQSGVIPMAFACGKTVVVTNVGGLSEQVPLGTGIIVNPDANEIALNIIELYSNPKQIRIFGENAFEYAKKELSWEHSADLLCKFLSI